MNWNVLVQKCELEKFQNKTHKDCRVLNSEDNVLQISDSEGGLIFNFLLNSTVFGLNEIFLYGHIYNEISVSKAHLKLFN
jgi:hypothetical protein